VGLTHTYKIIIIFFMCFHRLSRRKMSNNCASSFSQHKTPLHPKNGCGPCYHRWTDIIILLSLVFCCWCSFLVDKKKVNSY